MSNYAGDLHHHAAGPEPLVHTFTVTVEIDPEWVTYVTKYSDIFGEERYG